jgi:hypothetical protein
MGLMVYARNYPEKVTAPNATHYHENIQQVRVLQSRNIKTLVGVISVIPSGGANEQHITYFRRNGQWYRFSDREGPPTTISKSRLNSFGEKVDVLVYTEHLYRKLHHEEAPILG